MLYLTIIVVIVIIVVILLKKKKRKDSVDRHASSGSSPTLSPKMAFLGKLLTEETKVFMTIEASKKGLTTTVFAGDRCLRLFVDMYESDYNNITVLQLGFWGCECFNIKVAEYETYDYKLTIYDLTRTGSPNMVGVKLLKEVVEKMEFCEDREYIHEIQRAIDDARHGGPVAGDPSGKPGKYTTKADNFDDGDEGEKPSLYYLHLMGAASSSKWEDVEHLYSTFVNGVATYEHKSDHAELIDLFSKKFNEARSILEKRKKTIK